MNRKRNNVNIDSPIYLFIYSRINDKSLRWMQTYWQLCKSWNVTRDSPSRWRFATLKSQQSIVRALKKKKKGRAERGANREVAVFSSSAYQRFNSTCEVLVTKRSRHRFLKIQTILSLSFPSPLVASLSQILSDLPSSYIHPYRIFSRLIQSANDNFLAEKNMTREKKTSPGFGDRDPRDSVLQVSYEWLTL